MTALTDLRAAACWYCSGPAITEDEDCPPICQACADIQQSEYEYKASGPEKFVYRLVHRVFHATHSHAQTGGFDPYAGEVWVLTRGKLRVKLSDLVSDMTIVNGHYFNTDTVLGKMGMYVFRCLEAVRQESLYGFFEACREWDSQ